MKITSKEFLQINSKIKELIDTHQPNSCDMLTRTQISRTIDYIECFLDHVEIIDDECNCDPTGLRDFEACDFCKSQEKEMVF